MSETPPHEFTAPDTVARSRTETFKLLYGCELALLQYNNYNECNSSLSGAFIIAVVMWVIDGSHTPPDMPDTDIAKFTSAVRYVIQKAIDDTIRA